MAMTNPLDTALNALSNPLVAGLTSFTSTLGLAAEALPIPSALPGWLPYLVSICGPALVALMVRVLAGLAARKRALAAAKEARARTLRSDRDPTNDGQAAALEDEALALRADADALEAARK